MSVDRWGGPRRRLHRSFRGKHPKAIRGMCLSQEANKCQTTKTPATLSRKAPRSSRINRVLGCGFSSLSAQIRAIRGLIRPDPTAERAELREGDRFVVGLSRAPPPPPVPRPHALRAGTSRGPGWRHCRLGKVTGSLWRFMESSDIQRFDAHGLGGRPRDWAERPSPYPSPHSCLAG